MKQFQLIEGAKAINLKISGIHRAGKAIDASIHLCACSILSHVDKHGDTTLANRLLAAMPKGARVNALIKWFEDFGKMKFKDAETGLKYVKEAVTKLEEGIKNPWYDYTVEAPYKGFDLKAQIAALVKRAAAAADETDPEKAAKNKIDPAVLTALRELA